MNQKATADPLKEGGAVGAQVGEEAAKVGEERAKVGEEGETER